MIGKLIGKLVIWGLLSVFVGIVALGGYFYYKAGQPMQVSAAQRLAPGITYREFWADRIQRWNEIDDQNANKGKGKSCVLVSTIMLPMMYTGSIYEVTYLRTHRDTKAAAEFLRNISNIAPPDELIYGHWWKLPDAWWWQIENMSWWDYYRPLARAVYCEAGAPLKPTQE